MRFLIFHSILHYSYLYHWDTIYYNVFVGGDQFRIPPSSFKGRKERKNNRMGQSVLQHTAQSKGDYYCLARFPLVVCACVQVRVLLFSLVPDIKYISSIGPDQKSFKSSALIHVSQSIRCFQAIWAHNMVMWSESYCLFCSLSSLSSWIMKKASCWCQYILNIRLMLAQIIFVLVLFCYNLTFIAHSL